MRGWHWLEEWQRGDKVSLAHGAGLGMWGDSAQGGGGGVGHTQGWGGRGGVQGAWSVCWSCSVPVCSTGRGCVFTLCTGAAQALWGSTCGSVRRDTARWGCVCATGVCGWAQPLCWPGCAVAPPARWHCQAEAARARGRNVGFILPFPGEVEWGS